MKILVTGATGLLGSAVVRLAETQENVDAVYSPRVDLTTKEGIAELPLGAYDVVVHCAARIGGIKTQLADPSAAVTDNLVMSSRLFEACAKAKPSPLLVFVSSSTVYPAKSTATYGRNGIYNDALAYEDWPLKPESLYQGVGGVKVYLESLLDFYREKFGLCSVVVRPTAIYGPGDRSDHVIPDLLRRAIAGPAPLTVWGSPDTVRDFVYVDDVARGVLGAIEIGGGGGVFNLGSGVRTTMRQLADEVMLAVHGPHKLVELEDRYGPGKAVVFDAAQPSAIPVRQVSIERAKELLDWSPRVSLLGGLTNTAAWLKSIAAETKH